MHTRTPVGIRVRLARLASRGFSLPCLLALLFFVQVTAHAEITETDVLDFCKALYRAETQADAKALSDLYAENFIEYSFNKDTGIGVTYTKGTRANLYKNLDAFFKRVPYVTYSHEIVKINIKESKAIVELNARCTTSIANNLAAEKVQKQTLILTLNQAPTGLEIIKRSLVYRDVPF